MQAKDIYDHETGRESHTAAGFPTAAYVEWLERICAMTAGMVGIVESEMSVWNGGDVEDLQALFQRTV